MPAQELEYILYRYIRMSALLSFLSNQFFSVTGRAISIFSTKGSLCVLDTATAPLGPTNEPQIPGIYIDKYLHSIYLYCICLNQRQRAGNGFEKIGPAPVENDIVRPYCI